MCICIYVYIYIYIIYVYSVCVFVCVQAVDRGVAFEVSYSAAIRDATMRRYTIANAVSLMDTCKGKVHPVCPTGSDVISLFIDWV